MHKSFYYPFLLIMFCCSTKEQKSSLSSNDSLADAESAKPITRNRDGYPQLDLTNYKVYAYTDTAIMFKDPSYLGDHEIIEPDSLKTDRRVERTLEGLRFQLKNGSSKVLKENREYENEEYVQYSFIKSWNDIGQWQVLSMYNEGFSYLLINQTDGTESTIWSDPAFSPDKKYFLTGSADIDAGFLPNGFQLWTFQDNKLIKVWEKELADWGADNLMWTNNNYIIGEQVYRDPQLGESNKRIIKMRMIY